MTDQPFQHRMAAHCESGTLAAQLTHAGLPISEPMVFGIAGAIFFGYFNTPFMTFPTIVLRFKPGCILSRTTKRLGARLATETFRRPAKAMEALDARLAQRAPVGVQVDFFYMNYIPAYARVHFNAHYINLLRREGERYVVSDSYAPELVTLERDVVERARFARGTFAPKGLLFHVENLPDKVDWDGAIRQGIADAVFYMRRVPIPFMGIRGIRWFAKRVLEWPRLTRDIEHLSHEIMMIHIALEERGTGGGGFRFLYATFLQEAATLLNHPDLAGLAREMMENGDRWREISLFVARIGKNRDLGPDRLGELNRLILERADVEDDLFTRLAQAMRR